MKSLPTLAAAAALFTGFTVFSGFSSPASAAVGEMEPYGTVGHWQINGNEKVCRAHSDFQNGTTLSFYINVSGGLSIAIKNPKWEIPNGDYEVSAQVDRTTPGRMTATAYGKLVFFGLSGTEADFNLLSYGRVLYVTIGQQVYQYELYRSEAMLKALGRCATTRAASANPFAGSPPAAVSKTPPASTETPSNPFRRL
jgi:hypothetical protein